MLRKIALTTGSIPVIVPDGIYGDTTRNAVISFKSQNGLPTNDDIDLETWNTIFDAYKEAMFLTSRGEPIYPFPSRDYEVAAGERTDFIMILQTILSSLSAVYDDFEDLEINGIYDEQTKNAVKRFQKYHLLEDDGVLDKRTWDTAARSFNTHFSHRHYV